MTQLLLLLQKLLVLLSHLAWYWYKMLDISVIETAFHQNLGALVEQPFALLVLGNDDPVI